MSPVVLILLFFAVSLPSFITSGIRALVRVPRWHRRSMIYRRWIYKTRFSLWQVKMRAVLAQSQDLDDALEGFGKKNKDEWTAEEKRRDRKALSLI